MKNLIALVLFVFILSGCSSSSQGDSEFLSFADEFITAFNSKDVKAIDKYIDKSYGLFVIYNPGAYVVATNLNSFADIMAMTGDYDVGNLKITKVDCVKMRKGSEPVYSCEEDRWNKTGCFYGTKKDRSLVGVYDDMIKYDLLDAVVAPELREKAAASEKNYVYFVYNTDQQVGFYFGSKNGKYYLIAIDRVTPCEA